MKNFINKLKTLKRNIQLKINKIGSKNRNKKILNKKFTIISNNCFGGITYEYLDLQYLSPTIGLYFFAPEYIKFINNIKYYVNLPLKQITAKKSRYYNELKRLHQESKIIGIIDDVEIVFLHYNSFEEAKIKWEKRCKRINYDNIIYKFNDQNLCTKKELEAFNNFNTKNKICFTSKKYDYEGFIWMKKYSRNEFVKEDSYYYHKYLDIISYVNNIDKKKKIIHFLFSNRFSGAENVACNIIENLQSKYDISYCSPRGPIEKTLSDRKIDYITIDKINLKNLKKIIREYNPDIIHAHDYLVSFKCALVKGKRKLIAHLHNNSPWLKKICLKSFALLYTAFKSTDILTVSSSIEKEYIFSKFIKNKIKCIGNPVSRKKILEKVNKYSKKYDICCVARISVQKNPLKFAQLIYEVKKEIPNIKAIWVGDSNECDGNIKAELINKINKLELNNNLILVGFKENPYNYLNQSKIFLLTSEWEGYGLVAFEALSLGLPCIVSNVGGLPMIVNDECGKLCNSINDYKKEIVTLLNNKEKYDKISKAAIKRANEIDNLEQYIDIIDNIYKEY